MLLYIAQIHGQPFLFWNPVFAIQAIWDAGPGNAELVVLRLDATAGLTSRGAIKHSRDGGLQ
jgi:hypothetical protein